MKWIVLGVVLASSIAHADPRHVRSDVTVAITRPERTVSRDARLFAVPKPGTPETLAPDKKNSAGFLTTLVGAPFVIYLIATMPNRRDGPFASTGKPPRRRHAVVTPTVTPDGVHTSLSMRW